MRQGLEAHATHSAHASHTTHSAHATSTTTCGSLIFFRLAGDDAIGGEQNRCNAGGVLKCETIDLGRSDDTHLHEVAALAQSEHCADLVRFIADCGHNIEPDVAFWKSLQLALAGVTYDATTMPHPTRFIEMTGINRGSTAIQKRWVRPIAALALA